MRKLRIAKFIICLIIVLGMGKLHANAQAKGKGAEKAVATAVEALRVAMIDADSVKLSQLASDNLSYGHSSGVVQNKQEFVHALVTKASDFVTIELTNQTIQITGNTAIVRHVLSGATNDGGKPGNVKINILLVWHKTKGQGWQLLARQAFRVPAS